MLQTSSCIVSRYLSAVITFVLFCCLIVPGTANGKESLTLGLLPEMNVFSQSKRFQPLAVYLSKKIGKEVRFTILSRYGNIIKSLQKKQVDGAFLGSFTGTLAIHQLGVEPLARPVNLDGSSMYFGHIFVRKDSGIMTVDDMKGKIMAFVEQATTAGYVFPLSYLQLHGVEKYQDFFKEYYFTGSHDASISAVLSGNADIGAAKNTVFDHFLETNPRARREIVILASSLAVPSNGLCVSKDMDTELKNKLKNTLLRMKEDNEGKKVLKVLRALDFVETNKEDYEVVEKMASHANISLSNYQYENK